tara:strand:- start:256 stop:492 length:237 start_codon:yes stop_codon:yes gene_type:complete
MSTEDKVREIIVNTMGVDKEKVTLDTSFVDDLGADSLDAIELIMEFEEEFDIEISDENAEKISSVREAVNAIDYIKKL